MTCGAEMKMRREAGGRKKPVASQPLVGDVILTHLPTASGNTLQRWIDGAVVATLLTCYCCLQLLPVVSPRQPAELSHEYLLMLVITDGCCQPPCLLPLCFFCSSPISTSCNDDDDSRLEWCVCVCVCVWCVLTLERENYI